MVNHRKFSPRLYAPDGGAGSGGSSDSGGAGAGDAGAGAATDAGAGTDNGGAGDGTDDDHLQLGEAGKKALSDERKARRDAERQAKATAKELDTLRQQTMSDQEKAVKAARDEGRTEAMKETGVKLVDAEIRTLASGRNVDVDALLEGIDRSRFVDDAGDPDRKAIADWVNKIAPAGDGAGNNGFPDLGQGNRGGAGSGTDMNALIRNRMRSQR